MSAITDTTKDRILDVAERLFSEHGFEATSLRTITSECDVNLSSVNYHFGSKERLIHQVFARRVGPLNRRRLDMLDELESGDRSPELEEILRALFLPLIELACTDAGRACARLFGRTMTEPGESLKRIFYEQFQEVITRFTAALRTRLPNISDPSFFLRFLFLVGAMAFTVCDPQRIEILSKGTVSSGDAETILKELIAFSSAGLRAEGS